MKFLVFAASMLLLTACQTTPTKVVQQDAVQMEAAQNLQSFIKKSPVLLDARPAFEFNLNHVPGSINVRWEDFSQQDPRARGLLDKDFFSLARRLSLIGIDPDTPVLVLGKGPQGQGEEGRIAWTLKVLGVNNVTTAKVSELRSQAPREEPLIQNKPYWKPEVDETLFIDMKTFKDLVQNKSIPKSLPGKVGVTAVASGSAKTVDQERTVLGLSIADLVPRMVVLDVRGTQEYYLENLTQKKNVSVPITNIHWAEFFGPQGTPNKEVLKKLEALGITENSYIFVISKHGVRSGAVTYALRHLGWSHVTNVSGGYEQWGSVR